MEKVQGNRAFIEAQIKTVLNSIDIAEERVELLRHELTRLEALL